MPRATASKPRPAGAIEADQYAPIAPPDNEGRVAVKLPDLPEVRHIYVRNKTHMHYIIASKNSDVADLALGPYAECLLPDDEFWVRHLSFRNLITDRDDPDGNPITPPLEVFTRANSYKPVREVPLDSRCHPRHLANLELICYGPVDEAEEWINVDPMGGPDENRRDEKFLVSEWDKVLRHALWVLKENRRVGKEVDSRRLELIEKRVAEIDEIRRNSGIGLVYTASAPAR